MMTVDEIMMLLTEALPQARVEIEDLRGDGNHYAVTVESPSFVGLSLVDQHRTVFAALQGRVGGVLRGLTLTTIVPPLGDES